MSPELETKNKGVRKQKVKTLLSGAQKDRGNTISVDMQVSFGFQLKTKHYKVLNSSSLVTAALF